MSGIQRYRLAGLVKDNDDGIIVFLDDHLAALAAQATAHEAEMMELSNYMENSAQERYRRGVERGVSDERARIRAAVLEEERRGSTRPKWMDEGYASGVAAARDAVAALLDEFPNPDFQIANAAVHTAIAAIDALKGDTDD